MNPPAAKRRTLWMTDDLWARITKAAGADERTVSAWIRRAVEKSLKALEAR